MLVRFCVDQKRVHHGGFSHIACVCVCVCIITTYRATLQNSTKMFVSIDPVLARLRWELVSNDAFFYPVNYPCFYCFYITWYNGVTLETPHIVPLPDVCS